jgi:hypothetical protein
MKHTNQEAEDLILHLIPNLSREGLSKISGIIQTRNRLLAQADAFSLRVGDQVTVSGGKKLGTEDGEIIKVNRTRAIVLIDDKRWTVPFSLISKK